MITVHTTHRPGLHSVTGMLLAAVLILVLAFMPRAAHADSGETAAAVLLGAAFLYAAHEADKDRYERSRHEDHGYRERHHQSRYYHEEHYGHRPKVCRERGHRHSAHGKRPAHSYYNRGQHRGHERHRGHDKHRGRGRDDGPRWADGSDTRRRHDRHYRY